MTPELFCIRQSIQHARTLSYCDALKYLRGLMLLAGDIPEVADLREVIARMVASDAQLELLASAQRKLDLEQKGAGK